MSRFVRLTFVDFRKLVDSFDWKRQVRAVHVHHTWRPNHAQWQGLNSIEGMWRYHTEKLGWSDIAQHVTIDPEGFIWTGRGWNEPPASAAGFNGSRQAGPFMFELIGDFDLGRDPFGGAQKDTALNVTAYLCEKFHLATEAVRLHNELSTKSCPGTAIDRLTLLAEISARRPTVVTAARRRDKGGTDFDAQGLTEIRRAIAEAPDVEEAPEAELDDGLEVHAKVLRTPERRDVARVGLSPADRQILRRHVVNSRNGRFLSSGQFATTPIDVERIFQEHIRDFAKMLPDGQPLRLIFYAHGGLNSEETGLDIARHQIPWWLANDVYPIFFVWETGLLESLAQMLSPHWAIPGLRRGLGDALVDGSDELIEAICHGFGGVGIWSQMKLSAARGVDQNGATHHTIEVLASFLGKYKDRPVELHASGHSAGSIFHSFFLPEAIQATKREFQTLSLLAPAIRVDEFKSRLLAHMGKGISQTTIFTMNRDLELADNCFTIYRKSLLYLIDHALEPQENTPILGLEDRMYADRDLHMPFGLLGHRSSNGGTVVWSSTSPVSSGPSASMADSHGAFDDDAPTMNSLLRRVLGLQFEPLKKEFPGPREERALPPAIREPASYLSEPWRTRFLAATAARAETTVPTLAPARPLWLSPQMVSVSPNQRDNTEDYNMATGYSLHIGLNAVDPNHYDGWSGPLSGCENDADDMAGIARSQRYASTKVLLTPDATAGAFVNEMLALAQKLRPGDILFLSYSGHGGQVPDLDGDEQDDGQDETWCLYDRMLIDDELFRLFSRFAPDVRIFMLSDSCHSGSVARNIMVRSGVSFDTLPHVIRSASEALVPGGASLAGFERVRLAPPDKTLSAYMKNESMYRSLQAAASGAEQGPCAAGVILISGCQDNELSWDGSANGLFTQTLKHVWSNGAFEGDYGQFHLNIKKYLVGRQTPNFLRVGNVTDAFRQQKPLTI